jgi:hypothetical protein
MVAKKDWTNEDSDFGCRDVVATIDLKRDPTDVQLGKRWFWHG